MAKEKNRAVPTKGDSRSRRQFLKIASAASAGGAAALAMPNVSRAQDVITFKFQSTWPQKDIFHEYAQDYVAKVNERSGGRL